MQLGIILFRLITLWVSVALVDDSFVYSYTLAPKIELDTSFYEKPTEQPTKQTSEVKKLVNEKDRENSLDQHLNIEKKMIHQTDLLIKVLEKVFSRIKHFKYEATFND